MATKTVGVRELKEQAPKLVQRAERGERIVITRHGRPAAVLAPVDEDASEAASVRPRLREWRKERRSFESMLPKLVARFTGKFVAISAGKVVDSHTDADTLFRRVAERLGAKTFFIGRVGASEPVVDLPGFSIE